MKNWEDKWNDFLNQNHKEDLNETADQYYSTDKRAYSLADFQAVLRKVPGSEGMDHLDALLADLNDAYKLLHGQIHSYEHYEEGVEDTLDELKAGIKSLDDAADRLFKVFHKLQI